MDITKTFKKINNDYSIANTINDVLKYKFTYNGFNTYLFYTKTNNLGNIFQIIFDIDKKLIATTQYLVHYNNKTYFKTFIPNEYYSKISVVFKNDNWSPNLYFKKLFEHIDKTKPITTTKIEIEQINKQQYLHNNNLPFFHTFVRANISNGMKERVRKSFVNSKEIIDYCVSHNYTLRFTNDINLAKDLISEINIKNQ